MATSISVTSKLTVPALLEVNDAEFKHWYELGVWWAIYCDGQGIGVYNDCYLIINLTNHIKAGWYDNPQNGWLSMLGFEVGMVHGGYLTHPSDTLVVLTDLDFAKGYAEWRDPDAVLRYVLGCRIGELSGALIPALLPDPAPEAVTRCSI